jgi:hypothetical protein
LFAEGCAIFGVPTAAKLFRDQASSRKSARPAPPRKRKGAHDPMADRDLVDLWRYGGFKSKRDFARAALKNHARKIRGKVRNQENLAVDSLVRRLNRALSRPT